MRTAVEQAEVTAGGDVGPAKPPLGSRETRRIHPCSPSPIPVTFVRSHPIRSDRFFFIFAYQK